MSKDHQEEKDPNEKEQNVAQEEQEISLSEFMKESLEKATKEAQEYKDKYFRSLAEMENTRKRLQQEKQEMISYAIDNMLSEFLLPLDNLENALKYTDNLSDELKNWAYGFKMIAAQFTQVLENHGIIPFDSVGSRFDPHFHEAVETEIHNDHEEGTILAEVQKGYRHGKRVLRVAKVKVSKKVNQESLNKEENHGKEEK